jgi:hypothetical protein
MGAAAKRAVLINHAQPSFGSEHRTRAIFFFWQPVFAGGADGIGSDQSFACGEVGRFPRQLKLAAFGAAQAIALERTLGEVRVHGSDLCNGLRIGHDFAAWFGHNRIVRAGMSWCNPALSI